MNKYKNNLKKMRERQGYTQWALANKLDLTQGLISIYEAGNASPLPKTQERIAKVLECKVTDIWKKE